MAQIYSLANQKGGVGKTTTAMNLATALAAIKKHVLVVDADPQGNMSTGLGCLRKNRAPGTYEFLAGASGAECIQATHIPLLDLMPTNEELAGAEIELVSIQGREIKLKEALATISDKYDFIFIDCPPSLGLLTLNALVASHFVLIPMQCEFYSLEGLSHLLRSLERIQGQLNPDLAVGGIILTMYDRRNKLSHRVLTEIREHFPKVIFETVIPRNVRVSEAPSFGKPVLLYDIGCSGSRAYMDLARELLSRGAPEEKKQVQRVDKEGEKKWAV